MANSQTAKTFHLKRERFRRQIFDLLADGQRRRSKDVAQALGAGTSLSLCSRILTQLHEAGLVVRSEQIDPRDPSGTRVPYFYREVNND